MGADAGEFGAVAPQGHDDGSACEAGAGGRPNSDELAPLGILDPAGTDENVTHIPPGAHLDATDPWGRGDGVRKVKAAREAQDAARRRQRRARRRRRRQDRLRDRCRPPRTATALRTTPGGQDVHTSAVTSDATRSRSPRHRKQCRHRPTRRSARAVAATGAAARLPHACMRLRYPARQGIKPQAAEATPHNLRPKDHYGTRLDRGSPRRPPHALRRPSHPCGWCRACASNCPD